MQKCLYQYRTHSSQIIHVIFIVAVVISILISYKYLRGAGRLWMRGHHTVAIAEDSQ